MAFLKFRPDQIFTGKRLLDPGAVLVTSNDGEVIEIVAASEAGGEIQRLSGILSPGFVNTHCHLELSHLRGMIPERTGLVDFVFSIVSQRHFPATEISAGIQQGEDEMLANGIVAVGDICNNNISLYQKQKGRLAYYNFIEVSGWDPQVAPVRFEKSRKIYESFAAIGLDNSMVPHAPYSVSGDLWKLLQPMFAGKTVSIHNQETAFEDELFGAGTGDFTRMYGLMNTTNASFKPTGLSSLRSCVPILQSAGHLLLVHNTYTTEADIHFMAGSGLRHSWCICINANLYIEGAIPPLQILRLSGANIVVGTDSLASNHQLDILAELRTITSRFPAIPLGELLQWATSNGAFALGMDDRLGSFEKGKKPGILLLKNIPADGNLSAARVERLL